MVVNYNRIVLDALGVVPIYVSWIGNIYIHKAGFKQIVKLLYWLHLTSLSYCQTKCDKQNKETKHLLKLCGSDI